MVWQEIRRFGSRTVQHQDSQNLEQTEQEIRVLHLIAFEFVCQYRAVCFLVCLENKLLSGNRIPLLIMCCAAQIRILFALTRTFGRVRHNQPKKSWKQRQNMTFSQLWVRYQQLGSYSSAQYSLLHWKETQLTLVRAVQRWCRPHNTDVLHMLY